MTLTFARSVPLARRNLFEDRRRSLLALTGIGAGLLMVLLMSGVFVGITRQETAYIDNSPADVFVSQRGTRSLQLSTTTLEDSALARARSVPGVAWAEPLRHTTTVALSGEQRLLTYLYGYETVGGRGGPRSLVEGTAPGDGEVVLDVVGAGQLGVGVGDTVSLFLHPLRVSGLVEGLAGLGNTTMFVTSSQFAALAGPGLNWVLLGSDGSVPPEVLVAQIETAMPDVTAQTRAEFSHSQARIIGDLYTDVVRIMVATGFLIAMALVALTLSTVTNSKLPEYGVVKALGASERQLMAIVLSQALWAIAVALAAATVLAFALAAIIGAVLPNIDLVIEPVSIVKTIVGALVVGAPAAVLPLRRVLRLDPATAFRRIS